MSIFDFDDDVEQSLGWRWTPRRRRRRDERLSNVKRRQSSVVETWSIATERRTDILARRMISAEVREVKSMEPLGWPIVVRDWC